MLEKITNLQGSQTASVSPRFYFWLEKITNLQGSQTLLPPFLN